jgi:hypothetical protein
VTVIALGINGRTWYELDDVAELIFSEYAASGTSPTYCSLRRLALPV